MARALLWGHRGRGLAAILVTIAFAGSLGSAARGRDAAATQANGRIAFSDVTGIASMNPDGSGQWGVELNVGDTAPAWSPDGAQLAVVTHRAGNAGILVMQPDGSGGHMLTTDPGDQDPAWSPDGSKLAFANGAEIGVVKADGSGGTQLTKNGDGWAAHPSWSPDGGTIVFALSKEWSDAGGDYYASRLILLDVGSGKETQLTSGQAYDSAPAWSSDGSQIAFASTRDGNSRIYLVSPDGTGLKSLTDGSGWDATPAWSPDGTQIAFARNQQIWVTANDGAGAHQLTSGDRNSTPAWQPLAPAPSGCTLWGTAGNDLLVGTDGNDVTCGQAGDDTLTGLGGGDVLDGGDGNDYLAGGLGLDVLRGGAGADTLDARDGGLDIVVGGAGVDAGIVDAGRLDRMNGIERPKVDRNLAAWRPAAADAFEPTNPPQRAFDGRIDDWWNSGGYPSHWIEVDLQRPVDIARVRLVTPELANGQSFLLAGRASTTDPFRLLHVFSGPTIDLEALGYAPRRPWHGIRFLRLAVQSTNGPTQWVSWHEIEVYGPIAKKHRARKR